MPDLASALLESATDVAGFGACTEDFRALSDADLLSWGEAIAALKRQLGAYETHAAAEVSRRSKRELGHGGLAARKGFSSAKKLLETVTRVSGREASQLISLGEAMDEAEATRDLLDSGVQAIGGEAVELPWDAEVTAAIAAGAISVDCAGALRRGLGGPNEQVDAGTLREAVSRLLVETLELGADRVYRAARLERDLIDLTGVKARQQELYERGGFRLYPKTNGMYGFAGEADPESAAILSAALDPLTSPRRGGPRFVDAGEQARAQAIVDDPRTTERMALDGLVELVRLGSGVDPQRMYGRMRPVVKVLVTDETLHTGEGFGIIESSNAPVSVESIASDLCSGDSVDLTITADGTPLDLGRTRRLYDRRQREALAARDGGCLWPGCDQPPAMTEAHHTRQWQRDHGRTDVGDGVLLCRFHHMQLHNNGWEIQRRRAAAGDRSAYWLVPPSTADPERTPVLLESKSPLMKQLRRRPPRERRADDAEPNALATAP